MKYWICMWMIAACLVTLTFGGWTVQATETGTDKEETSEQTGATENALYIDNNHLYDGMDQTYAKGYVPKVKRERLRWCSRCFLMWS